MNPDPSHQSDAVPAPMNEAEAIAARAYGIYLSQGSTDGHADRDWLEAEAQVRSEQSMGSRPAYSL